MRQYRATGRSAAVHPHGQPRAVQSEGHRESFSIKNYKQNALLCRDKFVAMIHRTRDPITWDRDGQILKELEYFSSVSYSNDDHRYSSLRY